ncbi:hypothetical protein PL81_41115 [Streptomyces sp. RSD-27]|nr:hypothetical protein PL81_41115 [Streptomyces sp. RSD-27]
MPESSATVQALKEMVERLPQAFDRAAAVLEMLGAGDKAVMDTGRIPGPFVAEAAAQLRAAAVGGEQWAKDLTATASAMFRTGGRYPRFTRPEADRRPRPGRGPGGGWMPCGGTGRPGPRASTTTSPPRPPTATASSPNWRSWTPSASARPLADGVFGRVRQDGDGAAWHPVDA